MKIRATGYILFYCMLELERNAYSVTLQKDPEKG